MAEGLAVTFDVLTNADNEAAVAALIPALDSRHEPIRNGALASLLLRHSTAAHREILTRLHALDENARQIVRQHPGRMTSAIREVLLDSGSPLSVNAYYAVVWLQEYDLVPLLLNILEDPGNPSAAVATKVMMQLVDLLHEGLTQPESSEWRRDPQMFQSTVVGALEQSLRRFAKHKRRDVLEAFLLLADRDNAVLDEIFQTPYHPAFLSLIDILSSTPHASIIGLLLSYLDDPRAPSAVLAVVAKRSDAKFVQALLRKVSGDPSPAVLGNLKRISSVSWARSGGIVLERLDDASQTAAIKLVVASGMPRTEVFPVVERVLLHGTRGGRRAASEALDEFSGADANRLALKALADEDPQVQANVLMQIRRRGIPGALPRLVAMIDSRHAVVRDAARQSLAEFSFKRFLGAFDMLEEEVRRTTGALVKKIDPQTIPLLQAEMESSSRARRLRGIEMATTMDCISQLEATVIQLLSDEDHMVRTEAATALALSPSTASREALTEGLQDSSMSVQEACSRSLQEQERFTQWRETLVDPRD